MEEARRQREELRIRQEEEARRQEEELKKNWQGAQRQQCPKTRRFHPYMNARERGLESNQETDEVTFIEISCIKTLNFFFGYQERAPPLGAMNQYGLRWDRLQNSTKGTRFLSFSDIPWPTKSTLSNPPDITNEAVKSFLASFGLMSNSKECVQWIRKELKCWHPDKFSAFILPMVYEDQVRQVAEAVNNVSGILANLMQKAHSSSDV